MQVNTLHSTLCICTQAVFNSSQWGISHFYGDSNKFHLQIQSSTFTLTSVFTVFNASNARQYYTWTITFFMHRKSWHRLKEFHRSHHFADVSDIASSGTKISLHQFRIELKLKFTSKLGNFTVISSGMCSHTANDNNLIWLSNNCE